MNNSYSASAKVGEQWQTMIKFGPSKNGKLQLSFTPEFKPLLLEWLKAKDNSWLNLNVKDWGSTTDQPSAHDQSKQDGYIPY